MTGPLFCHRFRWGIDAGVDVSVDGTEISVASGGGVTVCVIGMLVSMADRAALQHDATWVLDSVQRGIAWTDEAAGDYAVVVFEAHAQRLTLTKNAAGTRPLFFTVHDDGVAVSTSFVGLGAESAAGMDFDVDADALARYLVRDALQPGQTLRRDVRTFSGGYRAIFSPLDVTLERHWWPPDRTTIVNRSVDEVAAEVREIIRTVVDDVIARNPSGLGVHLTPGLDSTTVARLAVDACRSRGAALPAAFSWQPPPVQGEVQLDQRLTAEVAAALGVDCRWQPTTKNTMAESLRLDPLALPVTSTLSSELDTMRAAARAGVHTMLCGWGGDEFVSYNGRHRLTASRRRRVRAALSRMRRRGVRQGIRPHAGFGAASLRRSGRRSPDVESTARATQTRLLEMGFLAERTDSWSVVGAEHGLRYAYPLLDRRVLDYVLSLDGDYFTGGRTLMRLIAKGLVPEAVRLNIDKTDAARSARSSEALMEATEELLARGFDSQIDPARRALIDAVRLRSAIATRPITQPGRVVRALQLVLRRDLDSGASTGRSA